MNQLATSEREVTLTRVLLVVRWPIGGIRTFFSYVYSRLEPTRYSLTIVAPEVPEAILLVEGLRRHFGDNVRFASVPASVSQVDLAWRSTGLLMTRRFDLVHSHGFTANTAAVLGAGMSGTPHLVTLHETLDAGRFEGVRGRLRKIALATALSATDRVHCVSADARRNLLEFLPLSKRNQNKITVIPNGIDATRFRAAQPRDLRAELRLPADTFLIGFLGRFMPEKGFEYLLDAMALLCREQQSSGQKPILLSFSPEDAYFREEKSRAKSLGLDSVVRFMPYEADISAAMRGLDVVVMPSIREASGLVAMETLVAGVPLIGATCIGLRETLIDTPARLVAPGDSDAIARELVAEMTSPSTVVARQFAAVAAERFDVSARAIEIEGLMRECIGSGIR